MAENYRVWMDHWSHVLGPVGRILLIVVGAWLLNRLTRALIARLSSRAIIPAELAVAFKRGVSSVITLTALLLALEQVGVSATVLWTAFTGFIAVAAIAFFAGWSVLSNVFCMLLIVATRPFRLYDDIEVLENGEKPGLRGRVIDLNLIYTTLREPPSQDGASSVLHVPNSLFFQRVVRRWGPRRSELAGREESSVQ